MKTAYPSTMTAVSITLYANVPFDNTYKHHTIISELFKYNNSKIYHGYTGSIACESFLNRLDYSQTGLPYYYKRWLFAPETYNFNFTNGLVCSITLELTAEQTNANYMKVVSGSDIYYYFITSISQVNFETYTLNLELDVIMTYQDEFLNGVKDVPILTRRKHCHRYTENGLMPYCADFKTGDDAFSGVKPSIISSYQTLDLKGTNIKKIDNLMWLYVCVEGSNETALQPLLYTASKSQEITYPLIMFAFPLNGGTITYEKSDGTCSVTYTNSQIEKLIYSLIDAGKVHGCKLSPYPPFVDDINPTPIITYSGNDLKIASSNVVVYQPLGGQSIYKMTIGNNELYYTNFSGTSTDALVNFMLNGAIIVGRQYDITYDMEDILASTMFGNTDAPTITSTRYDEPKLLFSPFKKYMITAKYSSQGYEYFPELIFSDYKTTVLTTKFNLHTNASAYIGDNNIFTYITCNVSGFNNYKYDKVGLASSINYNIPCGTNALDVFNATQKASFYQSKIASGITSGLTIAGGAGSVAIGVASLLGTLGLSAGASVGMIATGATAMASGVANAVSSVASSVTKIEDLKNTPDSINISGSSYTTDEGFSTINTPYLITYDVTRVIKENANDYFYDYGYQVARCCFFNTEVKFSNGTDEVVDNNLFGRTIFNFIQINEDITNKIDANIPYIAKQKLSSIFNNGITIWNFFGFKGLWEMNLTPSAPYNNVNNWFMKQTYDNTEYKGSYY